MSLLEGSRLIHVLGDEELAESTGPNGIGWEGDENGHPPAPEVLAVETDQAWRERPVLSDLTNAEIAQFLELEAARQAVDEAFIEAMAAQAPEGAEDIATIAELF